jgi:hypothetical protein
MRTVANVFWFCVLIAFLMLVAPALLEFVGFILAVCVYAIVLTTVATWLVGLVVRLFGCVACEEEVSAQATWSF